MLSHKLVDAAGNALARLTQKGLDGMPKAAVTNTGAAPAPSQFAIIANATPPESKRGVGRVAGLCGRRGGGCGGHGAALHLGDLGL